MANTTLTADIIAKEALAILENQFGWLDKIHRAYEDEWTSSVNGYKKGDTIRIRRPADFTVRTGANVSTSDVIEGRTTLAIDQQIGVDFVFSSTDLTLKIDDLSNRVIKPAMSNIINHMANDVLTVMYKGLYNWVGTAGNTVDSYADFAKAPERLDLMAVPQEDRVAIFHPSDNWGLIGAQTGLYINDAAKPAYRDGSLGRVAGFDTYSTGIAPSHTNGTRDNTTPLVKGASQTVTYDTAKNSWTMSLNTDGHDASVTIKAGDVFTIANVYMVNPKTKVTTGVLQQFVVTADVTADGTTTNTTTLTISPPIITSGPHQTVNAAPADDAVITFHSATASAVTRQNLAFHKNCMGLAVVPMEMPAAAYGGARKDYKGLSVRVIPGYTFATDVSAWRLDLLYGRTVLDPRLGTRFSGT